MRYQISTFAILAMLIPVRASAFLDAAAQAARDLAKSAVYVNNIAELVDQLDDSSQVSQQSHRLDDRLRALSQSSSEIYFMSSEFRDLSRGPDWSSSHLDENIRYTSKFISRMKRLMVTMGLLGLDAATAMNTAETNGALKEVLKNQQAQILMQKEIEIQKAETEAREIDQWQKFIESEKAIRNKSAGAPYGLK